MIKGNLAELKSGFETVFIDALISPNQTYTPQFVLNKSARHR